MSSGVQECYERKQNGFKKGMYFNTKKKLKQGNDVFVQTVAGNSLWLDILVRLQLVFSYASSAPIQRQSLNELPHKNTNKDNKSILRPKRSWSACIVFEESFFFVCE